MLKFNSRHDSSELFTALAGVQKACSLFILRAGQTTGWHILLWRLPPEIGRDFKVVVRLRKTRKEGNRTPPAPRLAISRRLRPRSAQ